MSDALWTEAELTRTLGAPSAPLGARVGGVSIDTRTLQPGDLFFAIKGEVHDGHDHVARAFEAGAAAAVIANARGRDLAAHEATFGVEDTLGALERLGRAARARTGARIVAVTGSVGKTSAKEMLRVALAKAGPTHASAASYNNHWGVPLTLSRMPANAAFGVVEIGMNHAGEITPLVAMARPHVALVTTIAPVHVEHLGSIEAIADAKAEIFSAFEPDAAAILNRDAAQFDRLERGARARGARVLTFGADAICDARLLDVAEDDGGSRIRARVLGRELAFALGAPGVHMAQNALGVLLAADALGADLDRAAAALAEFAPQKGRGERFTLQSPSGPFTVIDESYNANPASMRAALALLGAARPGVQGRRIAVIGDMLELGPGGAEMHAALAGVLSENRVDLIFGAGPLTRALFDAAPAAMRAAWAERSRDIQAELTSALRGGDVVMVKGSNGSRMGPVVAGLREHFSSAKARQ
ncbi:MAG TPA: UDP-N-acetylmuramoylalanyl-D-glutamyl-2,6-diaminopimelate--D-alanyl-D-alanine ligase [Roseiarcus sp.]|nr:UDP-N-acetylmuramoylalanyl-D-glutamyl-2,6-diaminopimelate--D-alanyl-D-alanine ligase [Roseiarcus sp.]